MCYSPNMILSSLNRIRGSLLTISLGAATWYALGRPIDQIVIGAAILFAACAALEAPRQIESS